MAPVQLEFSSTLHAPRARVWDWITGFDGISAEMRPIMRMTAPRGVRGLEDVTIVPGECLFRSVLLLFGVLPFGYSDLTLVEFDPGWGFVEQSPMASMKSWRHERRIQPGPAIPGGAAPDPDVGPVMLLDQLTFEPRLLAGATRWFVQRFFTNRHNVLRRAFATP